MLAEMIIGLPGMLYVPGRKIVFGGLTVYEKNKPCSCVSP